VENRLGKEIRKRLERALPFFFFFAAGNAHEASVEWGPDQFRRDILARVGVGG
jgi:hypothetical protein